MLNAWPLRSTSDQPVPESWGTIWATRKSSSYTSHPYPVFSSVRAISYLHRNGALSLIRDGRRRQLLGVPRSLDRIEVAATVLRADPPNVAYLHEAPECPVCVGAKHPAYLLPGDAGALMD